MSLNADTDIRSNVDTVQESPCECRACEWSDVDPADCRCPNCDPDWYRDQAQANAIEAAQRGD